MTNPEIIKALTDTELTTLIETSSSLQEILDKLNIKKDQRCKELIKSFAKDKNISMLHMQGKNSLIARVSKSELEQIVQSSICWMDVIRGLNLTFHGSFYASLIKLAKYYNIDVTHFDTKRAQSIRNGSRLDDSAIFADNSTVARATVKNRIIKDNLIQYICDSCGNNGIWLNRKIVLQLEHRNGIRNDNRIENLCFLCPNCHSQTDTYTGKNNRK